MFTSHLQLFISIYRTIKSARRKTMKVLAFDPKNQMALYNLGAIAATQGKKDKAKEFWNKVISIDAKSETGMLAQESLGKLSN